jgi:mycoredoxin
MVPLARGVLDQANVEYEYINIYEDQAARERLRQINHGYESVPTLVFPDGDILTEPSRNALETKLKSLGY